MPLTKILYSHRARASQWKLKSSSVRKLSYRMWANPMNGNGLRTGCNQTTLKFPKDKISRVNRTQQWIRCDLTRRRNLMIPWNFKRSQIPKLTRVNSNRYLRASLSKSSRQNKKHHWWWIRNYNKRNQIFCKDRWTSLYKTWSNRIKLRALCSSPVKPTSITMQIQRSQWEQSRTCNSWTLWHRFLICHNSS